MTTIILVDRYLFAWEREALRRRLNAIVDDARANGDRRLGWQIATVVAR